MAPRAEDRRKSAPKFIGRLPKLRVLRAQYGISVTEMAKDIGLDRSSLSRVLNGQFASERTVELIAKYFEVPVNEVFQTVDVERPLQSSQSGAHAAA